MHEAGGIEFGNKWLRSQRVGRRRYLVKRQKPSAPLGGGTALNGHSGQLQHSPPPISEDDEDDGSGSISADGNLVSSARTTPAAFEPVFPLTTSYLLLALFRHSANHITFVNISSRLSHVHKCLRLGTMRSYP
jgi:hypothetical protein